MQASGGAASAALVDSVAACAAAGRSSSTDPFADSVGLWSALHGLASLRVVMTDVPWPAQDDTAHRIIHYLGRIADPDTGSST
jgi:Tetracyclin repressor-like, C-terminal domain